MNLVPLLGIGIALLLTRNSFSIAILIPWSPCLPEKPPAAALTAQAGCMLDVRHQEVLISAPEGVRHQEPAGQRPRAPTLCGPTARGPDSVLFQLSLRNCSDSARTCQCVLDLRLISFEMEFWLNSSNRCCCKICFSGFLLKAILRGSFTTLPVVQSIHLITTYRLFSIKWRQQISSLNMTSLFCKTRFWKLKAIIFI